MIALVSDAIEEYAEQHTAAESPVFQGLAKETYAKTKVPQMQVGRLEGAFLRLLVRLTRAERVLEIGTFTGYSALAMAEGLPENGKLWTCDISEESTAIAQRFWDQSPAGSKIELRLGPALETIKALDETFDLVFIDADKENYTRYWDAVLPKVRTGGLIVADNVLWSGRVLDPQDESDRAIVAFNKHVAADERVESVMLTVRDGVTLAYKR